jgi:hypothetical protein
LEVKNGRQVRRIWLKLLTRISQRAGVPFFRCGTITASYHLDALESYLVIVLSVAGGLLLVLLALVVWAVRDVRPLASTAALLTALLVLLLPVVGLVIYLLLRPRETLVQAYDRALEQEALLQQIEEKPVCPTCARPTQPAWFLCPTCHTHLRQPCPVCRSPLELHWDIALLRLPVRGESFGRGNEDRKEHGKRREREDLQRRELGHSYSRRFSVFLSSPLYWRVWQYRRRWSGSRRERPGRGRCRRSSDRAGIMPGAVAADGGIDDAFTNGPRRHNSATGSGNGLLHRPDGVRLTTAAPDHCLGRQVGWPLGWAR